LDQVKQEIMRVGRAMLALGFQNTHSGNISVRNGDEMYITKTGSLKGHLAERDICRPGLAEPEYGLFQTSSETGEHRRVLEFAGAMIHAHALQTVLLSYFTDSILPVDVWGRKNLGTVPVLTFAAPIGSPEMEEKIPEALRVRPAMVVKTHGPFVRGATLDEAFFYLCLLENSGGILWQRMQLGIPLETPTTRPIPEGLQAEYSLPEAVTEIGDPVLLQQFKRTAHDLFYLKLSPFRTGSLSVRDGDEMIYASHLSVPEYGAFPIRRIRIAPEVEDYLITLHASVYRHSHARAALFTVSPEALIQADSAGCTGSDRIIPVDAEGGHLYPAVPVVSDTMDIRRIVEMAVRYKMVVISGIGVIALGHTPGHVIHHNSSIRTICLLRTGLQVMQRLGAIDDAEAFACERGKSW